MSSKSLVFSHQRDVVFALSHFFESVDVFTTELSLSPLPRNVRVFLLPWKPQSPVGNVLLIARVLYPVLMQNRTSVLFTHMADVHAAILSPFAWLLRIRHIFWYAHATNSKYLIWSSFFVSKIVSSTPGSCNLSLNKRKIHFINQGVNHESFPFSARAANRVCKIVYYGRLDSSKNIHLFPQLLSQLNFSEDLYTLDIFGRPTNRESEMYLSDIVSKQKLRKLDSSISFNGPIERSQIPAMVGKYNTFINLFSGSLDKTLIEATFMGLPVITWNREYCSQFGTWSNSSASESLDFIVKEFESINSLKESELQAEINRRLDLAVRSHSFEGWISRLVGVLKEGEAS